MDGVELQHQVDLGADLGAAVGVDLGDQEVAADAAVDDDLVAEGLDELHLGMERDGGGAGPAGLADVLRSHAEDDLEAMLARAP